MAAFQRSSVEWVLVASDKSFRHSEFTTLLALALVRAMSCKECAKSFDGQSHRRTVENDRHLRSTVRAAKTNSVLRLCSIGLRVHFETEGTYTCFVHVLRTQSRHANLAALAYCHVTNCRAAPRIAVDTDVPFATVPPCTLR